MDVSEESIDPTSKGPIECPNTTIVSVHFYISILEDVTTTLSVNFEHLTETSNFGHLSLRRTETSIIALQEPKTSQDVFVFHSPYVRH